jgi:hypothetical protein
MPSALFIASATALQWILVITVETHLRGDLAIVTSYATIYSSVSMEVSLLDSENVTTLF